MTIAPIPESRCEYHCRCGMSLTFTGPRSDAMIRAFMSRVEAHEASCIAPALTPRPTDANASQPQSTPAKSLGVAALEQRWERS